MRYSGIFSKGIDIKGNKRVNKRVKGKHEMRREISRLLSLG